MQKKLITIDEVAEMTSTSTSWWRAAISGRKKMPPIRIVRIGTSVRLHYDDLLTWIDAGALPPPQRKRGRPRKSPPKQNDSK